jgi:hypothetical protein
MIINLSCDAISRNVEGFGTTPMVAFSINSLTIPAASVVLILFQDRIGRKLMSSSAFLISGIFVMASGISMMTQKNSFVILGLYFVGRFGVAVAYDSAFLCKIKFWT